MESSLIWVNWARNQCKISYRFRYECCEKRKSVTKTETGRAPEDYRSNAYCTVLFIISIWIVSTYVFNEDSIEMKLSSNDISIIRFTSFTLCSMCALSLSVSALFLDVLTYTEIEEENLMQNCFFTYSLHLSSSHSYHFFRRFFSPWCVCVSFSLVENADSECNRYT